LHVAGDMTHLLAAGAWLGALPAFAALLGAAQRRDEAWRLFAVTATCRFAQIALLSVAVLTASGLLNAWNLIDRPSVLLATDYGRLLLLKLGLFAAMLAIAAVNRFHLTPQVPAPAATRALQRNSIGEIVLGFGVLLLVALLGTLSPNEHLHGTTQVPADAAFVHIHGGDAMAAVTVQPRRAGAVTVTIRLQQETGADLTATAMTLAFDMDGARKITRAANRLPDGTWQVNDLELPAAGIWTVRVILSTEGRQPIELDAPIVIEP
jgi:uncharacterized membrane protein